MTTVTEVPVTPVAPPVPAPVRTRVPGSPRARFAAPDQPAAPLSATVGIEPMTDALRDGGLVHRHARIAVVDRLGDLVHVVTTDNDPDRRQPLEAIVTAYAEMWGCAVAEPRWPLCPYCAKPDPECGEALSDHIRWACASETTGWSR